jgi:hypothetical protein
MLLLSLQPLLLLQLLQVVHRQQKQRRLSLPLMSTATRRIRKVHCRWVL